MLTLVASALAGGDFIDDADVLRTGGTACTLLGTVKAPLTLGIFLRSFRWGHVRQLDRLSRELLAAALAGRAGPCDGPLTIDLDSTASDEAYRLAKEGARHPPDYTGKRGYHPQTRAIAAGTARRADVPAARGLSPSPPASQPTSCGRRPYGCATLCGRRKTHATGRQRVPTPMAW